ncbi:MAG: hypothetical protein PV344_05675 [Anaplasma sp.]|nr:hypothetical protein [Anaplasma sp.]
MAPFASPSHSLLMLESHNDLVLMKQHSSFPSRASFVPRMA